MRKIAFVVMLVLAVVSYLEGQLLLALLFGGLKALLIGLEYMELRTAAREHLAAFAVVVVALTLGLVVIASG